MVANEDMSTDNGHVEDEVPLPGFRFHPTDEELVSFYLRRKLDNKPISIELIKQIDIYKHDPWDLPKATVSTGGEKEGYFYCKRGRKYRNSVRPNRVTGSGFWKATGIDKPVYSHGGEGHECVGLKKTLVYYRGSAGKGTKTDWMMHEFRLPNTADTINTKLPNAKNYVDHTAQEAEIWTLCRIFKRNVSQRKHTQELRLLGAKRQCAHDRSSRSMMSSVEFNTNQETYINFGASLGYYQDGQNPTISNYTSSDQRNNFHGGQLRSPTVVQQAQVNAASSNFWMNLAMSTDHFFTSDNWDELGSVVKFAA